MKITVIFDVESKDPHPDVVVSKFENYLFEMLYIGVDDDYQDSYTISDAKIHIYEI